MKRILIVEDEIKLAIELSKFLESNGYEVTRIECFEKVIDQVLAIDTDLVLLDLNLPGLDGHTICKEVRKLSDVAIIVVTSQNTEFDELISINYGADDFITKPYNLQILLARIERIFKRSGQTTALKYKTLTIDVAKSIVSSNVNSVELSRNEIRVLTFLLSRRGEIVSRDMLIDHLWNNDAFVDDNTLTVNINRVRNKLGLLGENSVIETRRGQGYIIL